MTLHMVPNRSAEIISVLSFNVRGIRERKKRRTIFRHLHVAYPRHIILLQETHSSVNDESVWQNEWGSTIIFSHGTVHQAGVAVLMPRVFNGSIRERIAEDGGRIAGVSLTIDGHSLLVLGIYAPAVDIQHEKIAVFDQLPRNSDETFGGKYDSCR